MPTRTSVLAAALLALFASAVTAHPAAAGIAEPTRAPSRPRPPVVFDIAASGDLLIHGPVAQAAYVGDGRYDFRRAFAAIRPIVRRAALAFCHVETPLGAGPRSGYPRFNAPPELARAIGWTGWDACSTASNHSLDRGSAGLRSTLQALERAGVRFTGTARSRAEARRILMLSVRHVRVAFLAYTYGTNGLPLARPWEVNLISPRRIRADARRARRLGADLVVVNLHWGSEYVHAPTREQRRLARRLLGDGAIDVLLGQHAHVVQPIRRLAGRFVVFGEGNLLSAQSGACCPAAAQDGLIVVLRVRAAHGRARVTGIDYVPTRVSRPRFLVEPVGFRFRRLVARGMGDSPYAHELRASFLRTTRVVGTSAAIRPLPRSLRPPRRVRREPRGRLRDPCALRLLCGSRRFATSA
jgi:hypothetical protein